MRLERTEEDWALSIADSGPGIPSELHDKIFNLYFTTKAGGSGIGLAMTFRIVQLHNGSIDFESKPGEGALFRMCFPAYDEKVPVVAGLDAVGGRDQSALPVTAVPSDRNQEGS